MQGARASVPGMPRATAVLAGTTLVGVVTSVWLYLDNRSLRDELEQHPAQVAKADDPPAPAAKDPWLDATPDRDARNARIPSAVPTTPPSLPPQVKETRMDRRARRTEEFGAMFGRQDGETEEEYRARIVPLIQAGLARPRERATEMRKAAEEKAKVTPEQSAKLDQAFDKVYGDVLDYTNKAIKDGTLSPYERNVAGWLDFAGGLGGILNHAQGQVGRILDASQIKTMYDAGFEWGEYLGLSAPWERLSAPPPRR
jgi:hypothetical protein